MPFTSTSIRSLAVAAIFYQGKILAIKGIDKVKNEVFYRLPGGGIEFGETSKMTLEREYMEEFGVDIKIVNLLDVAENIFEYEGKSGHEIIFIYEAEFADSGLYQPDGLKCVEENSAFSKAEWVEIIPEIKIYPEAIRRVIK